MAKLEEVKSLLSNKIPNGTFEDVFETMMDEFIDRHSPKKREERRMKKNKQAPSTKQTTEKSATDKQTRHIPATTRDKVYVRDNARCTYVGNNGKRCNSTHNLQIDHIKPVARGGPNTLSNLRLLCGKHNRLEAKRVLGEKTVERYSRRE